MTNPESPKDQEIIKPQTRNFDLELSDGVREAVAKVIDKHQRIYDEKSMKDQIHLMQKFPDRKGRDSNLNGVNVEVKNAEDCNGSIYENTLGYDNGDSKGPVRYSNIEHHDPIYKYHKYPDNDPIYNKLKVLKLKGNFESVSIDHFCTNGILDISEAKINNLHIYVDHRDHELFLEKNYVDKKGLGNIIGSDNITKIEIDQSLWEWLRERQESKSRNSSRGNRPTNNQGSSSDRETTVNGRSPELDDSTLDTFATYYIADAMTDNDSPSATNNDSDTGSNSSSSNDD